MVEDQVGEGLADEARQFALLVNSVTDYAIYMLDAQGRIRTWNPGGQRIKGYAVEEVLGTHYSRFYTQEDVASDRPARNLRIAAEHGRFAEEGWRVRKDGSRFRASVVIDPIHEDGELIGFAKVTRDVTERFESEQRLQEAQSELVQAQKMEAIGKLTLGLAHDFNNLLTIVVNSLDLIGSRSADASVARFVESGLRAAERGIVLTRQLLTFGRGQVLAPEHFDVNAVIGESAEMFQRAVGTSIRLELDLAPAPCRVDVDKAQFEAALLNLVSNSRDAMPGGGELRISTCMRKSDGQAQPAPEEGYFVCVQVQDSGSGILPEHQGRVFEPFFTTKEVGRGSGLGLSQVFGFAAQSGGFTRLSSLPERGTTVTIGLPAAGGRDAP